MMKTTTLLKTLPVLGFAWALSACGGGGDGSDSTSPSSNGSITACFTATKTVNFALTASGVPPGSVAANRSTVGPMTYNGQAATGQTDFYPTGNTISTETLYWTVTSSGVTIIANVDYKGTVTPGSVFFPQNMVPSQTVTGFDNTRYTLVGFESINLAGKIFSNACHYKADGNGAAEEGWYAPGYGLVKQIVSGVTRQYNGDL
jgi:hypothetical protein